MRLHQHLHPASPGTRSCADPTQVRAAPGSKFLLLFACLQCRHDVPSWSMRACSFACASKVPQARKHRAA